MSESKAETVQADPTVLTAYQAYQHNIRQAETLQEEVMRGAREGENICLLLLKTARAVSLMTGSDVFANQVEMSIKAVYGEALGEKAPLEMELRSTEERLERIRAASDSCPDPDIRQAMLNAVRAHELRVASLKERIGAGES